MRELVLGGDRVQPSPEQLREMCRQVRLGFDAGARMLSFGLVYLPGAYADTAELDAVAREAARVGAPLVPHVRNEGHGVLAAVEEMIGVARRSGAPLHLSHLKSLADERLVEPLLDLLDTARGGRSTSPSTSTRTAPAAPCSRACCPAWAQEGGAGGTLRALRLARDRARVRRDIGDGLPGWENILGTLGPERVEIANAAPPNEGVVGMTLAEIGGQRDCDPVEAALDLLVESELDVTMVLHYASDEAVRTIARHRLQLVGSDGIFGARPHPRLYGTAPRFLGRFAMREGLVPVEEAIARLTSRAADRLGLADRGRIAPGKRADLVLLDPERYVDTATYAEPARSPDGVVGVWVNGVASLRDGAPTGARAGGVVR